MKKVGIIIVNYKDYAKKYLPECITSLRKQTWRDPYQIFIIDNDGDKETMRYISTIAPESTILSRQDGNYSAANKLGIEHAIKAGCNYFIIANMDVIFDKNWLKELVAAIDRDENVGIVQAKVMLWPHMHNINSVGNKIHFLGFGFTTGYNEIDKGQYKHRRFIDGYASGCSLIIKRKVIDVIGNYDPIYYMYHDDLELGWRAKLAGYKIELAPKAIVYHKYEFHRSIRMLYYMERNRYIAIFSFYKIPTLLLITPPLLIMELGMLYYAFLHGWLTTKLKANAYFFNIQSWRHIAQTRQKVKNYRHVHDKEITKHLAGILSYQEIMNPLLKYIVNPVFNIYWHIMRLFIFW